MSLKMFCDICQKEIIKFETYTEDAADYNTYNQIVLPSFKSQHTCQLCTNTITEAIKAIIKQQVDPNPYRAIVVETNKNYGKIPAIKKLRELTGLGLKESKELVEKWSSDPY